jgi:hypothetical protein
MRLCNLVWYAPALVALGSCVWLLTGTDRAECLAELAFESSRTKCLEADRRRLDDRMAEKHRVVIDLAAGRLSLREATDRFREVHGPEPITYSPTMEMEFARDCPGVPVALLVYRDLIDRVRAHVNYDPGWHGRSCEAAAALSRLQAEFHAILAEARGDPFFDRPDDPQLWAEVCEMP